MEKITSLLYHYTPSEPHNSNPNPTTPFLSLSNTDSVSFSIISSLPFFLPLLFFLPSLSTRLLWGCFLLQGSRILFTETTALRICIHQRAFLKLLQYVAFMTFPFNIYSYYH